MRFAFLLLACAMLLFVYGCTGQPQAAQGTGVNCSGHSPESCPASCAVCPPCEACSSISCQTEQFCKSIGFNKSWYGEIKKNLAVYNASAAGNPPLQNASAGKITEYGGYLLYVPIEQNLLNDSIVIVAFSPSGDAGSMIGAWRAAAEKRGWPVFASKLYRNGNLPMSFNNDTFADIGNATASLNYTHPKLVFTGLSGGGQVSHAFAFGSPGKVAAVVTNCGIINRGFLNYTDYYPRNKTVLFIASPTDFRYVEMQQDKAYLEALGWKTGWIEFQGGHMLASQATYEQAADWLEQNVGGKKG